MAALAETHMTTLDAAIQKTTAKVSDAVLKQKDIVQQVFAQIGKFLSGAGAALLVEKSEARKLA